MGNRILAGMVLNAYTSAIGVSSPDHAVAGILFPSTIITSQCFQRHVTSDTSKSTTSSAGEAKGTADGGARSIQDSLPHQLQRTNGFLALGQPLDKVRADFVAAAWCVWNRDLAGQ